MAIFRRAILPIIVIALSGCLEYSERITINRDGSATIRLTLRVAGALNSLVQSNPAFRSLAILQRPEALERSLPRGVELKEHHALPGTSRRTYVNVLEAPDAAAIDAGGSDLFQDQTFTVETLADGSIRYERTLDFTQATRDPELAQMLAENRMGIKGILRAAPFIFELESPLKVTSTNGFVDGDTVRWEYMLLTLLEKPVRQELVLAPPTAADKLLGALRRVFRPDVAPFLAVFLLAVFFLAVRRRRAQTPA